MLLKHMYIVMLKLCCYYYCASLNTEGGNKNLAETCNFCIQKLVQFVGDKLDFIYIYIYIYIYILVAQKVYRIKYG